MLVPQVDSSLRGVTSLIERAGTP